MAWAPPALSALLPRTLSCLALLAVHLPHRLHRRVLRCPVIVVHLRGADTLVTKALLEIVDAPAALQEVKRVCVAELVCRFS